eukprot:169891_1
MPNMFIHFIWFCIILPRILAFKMNENPLADKTAGCGIAKLNDYRLVSFSMDNTQSGGFISVDSSGDPGDISNNVRQIRYAPIQGSAVRYAAPCSIFNHTTIIYAYSIGNNVVLDIVTGQNDAFHVLGSIAVTDDGNLTTDASIVSNELWSNTGAFITVWSQKSTSDQAYTIHARFYHLNQDLSSYSSFDVTRIDNNINNTDQLNPKIVKSKISERICIAWSEGHSIYFKIYSDFSEMFLISSNDVEKSKIMQYAKLNFTKAELYQVLPLSVGGFIISFDVIIDYDHPDSWTDTGIHYGDNYFSFYVVDEYGVSTLEEHYYYRTYSPYALDFPNYIGFVQMVEMPLDLEDHSNAYVKFIYSKYEDPEDTWFQQYTSYFTHDFFFHLDYVNGITFVLGYGDDVLARANDGGHCFIFCDNKPDHKHHLPRKLCMDLNADTYEYLLAGFTQSTGGDILHGFVGTFTDYYNCNTSMELTKYLCISGDVEEISDTYVMHGCYRQVPYYFGHDHSKFKFIYYSAEIDSYEIHMKNTTYLYDDTLLVFRCNVSDIHHFNDITQCNGHWYSVLTWAAASFMISDNACDDFEIPTTTTTTDPPQSVNVTPVRTASTDAGPSVSQDVRPTVSGNTQLSVSGDTPHVQTEDKNANQIDGSTITILVTSIVVAVVIILAICIIIKKKWFVAQPKQAVTEERANLKETEETQTVQAEDGVTTGNGLLDV